MGLKETKAVRVGKWGDDLLQLLIPIRDLNLDPENARTHSDRNLRSIRDSLSTFGQVKPIVYWYAPQPDGKDNVPIVVAGNGTFASARALGWTHIAAVRFEGSEAQARAYALADNRTAELAAWDTLKVTEHLEAIGATWEPTGGVEWSPSLVGFDVPSVAPEYTAPPPAPARDAPAAPLPRAEASAPRPQPAPTHPERTPSFPLLIHCRTRDERAGIAAELERHGLRCTVEGT